jgi:hypothetical protein
VRSSGVERGDYSAGFRAPPFENSRSASANGEPGCGCDDIRLDTLPREAIVERPDELCANRVEPTERPLILGLRSGVRGELLEALKRVACLVQSISKTGKRCGVV